VARLCFGLPICCLRSFTSFGGIAFGLFRKN